jgi:hypothetical protein
MTHNGHEPGALTSVAASGQSDDRASWLAEIVTGLVPGGVSGELHDTPDRLDVTASFDWPGHQKIEITVDDDGSVELHWREEPDTSPADVAAAIICAIAAVTGYRP